MLKQVVVVVVVVVVHLMVPAVEQPSLVVYKERLLFQALAHPLVLCLISLLVRSLFSLRDTGC